MKYIWLEPTVSILRLARCGEDFSGLPAVHIVTAEYDPLCDEGEALFQRLTEQGVTCTAQRWLGVIHGFFQLGGISQSARDVMRDIAGRIQHARGA